MSEYPYRALDFDRWLASVNAGEQTLSDAFFAGERYGSDLQRGDLFQSLPDQQDEALEEGLSLVAYVRRNLLHEQNDELPAELPYGDGYDLMAELAALREQDESGRSLPVTAAVQDSTAGSPLAEVSSASRADLDAWRSSLGPWLLGGQYYLGAPAGALRDLAAGTAASRLTFYRTAVLLEEGHGGATFEALTVLSDAGDEPPAGAVLVDVAGVRAALLAAIDAKMLTAGVLEPVSMRDIVTALFPEVQDGKR